jgi:hypothetical protein
MSGVDTQHSELLLAEQAKSVAARSSPVAQCYKAARLARDNLLKLFKLTMALELLYYRASPPNVEVT